MCLDVSKCVWMCPNASNCQMYPKVSKCVWVCLNVSKCVQMCPNKSKCVQMCPSVSQWAFQMLQPCLHDFQHVKHVCTPFWVIAVYVMGIQGGWVLFRNLCNFTTLWVRLRQSHIIDPLTLNLNPSNLNNAFLTPLNPKPPNPKP